MEVVLLEYIIQNFTLLFQVSDAKFSVEARREGKFLPHLNKHLMRQLYQVLSSELISR